MELKDKLRGVVFGVALGDAMGAPLEFMSKVDISWKYGVVEDMLGGGWLNLEPGETTDDTAMTVGIIKGVLDDWENPIEHIGRHFMNWYETNPRDIGITTKHALESYKLCRNWEAAGKKAHELSNGKSGGNGTLMRCAPIAVLYKNNYEKMIEITKQQSAMTHLDELTTEACCINNHIIWEILQGKGLEESIQAALEKYDRENRYKACLDRQVKYDDLKPTGFVVDTLRCSLYCLLNTQDFYDAIVMAINLGGDADTIGAVTGGLAGAYYGYESLPAIWVYQLVEFHELDELCRDCMKFIKG